MNVNFISAIQATLSKSIVLLDNLSTSVYTDKSRGPYYSSIGGHIRHVLDFYVSIFNGFNTYLIDLTDRKRDVNIESDAELAKAKIIDIISKLEAYKYFDLSEKYELVDDLGNGKISIPSNLYAVLLQANSHAIHHYAIISQILFTHNICIKDPSFGYNPSTPIPKEKANR